MKRRIIISLAATALLSIGLGAANQNNPTQAAVRVGRMTELKRNAYVYNKKGKKEDKFLSGESVKVIAITKIGGQKYARIGQNRYIKFVNFTDKPKKGTLKHNAYIYNAYGKRIAYKALKAGKQIKILGSKIIRGKRYYRIGANQYIKRSNVKIAIAGNRSVSNNSQNTNSKTTPIQQPTNPQQSMPATNPVSPTQPQQSIPVTKLIQPTQGSQATQAKPTTPATPAQPTQASQVKEKLPALTYHRKAIKVLHVEYIYNEKGKKILGSYVMPKQSFNWYGRTTIKGKKFYYCIKYEDETEYKFIPVSAFNPKGHGLSLKNAASDKQFAQYQKQIYDLTQPKNKYGEHEIIVNNPLFYLSSLDKQRAYRKAEQQASNVGQFAYSTKKDLDAAEAALQKAYNDLNGAPVVIKGTYDKPQMTDAERAQIIKLATNYFKATSDDNNVDIEDVHFSPNGTNLIYIENGIRRQSSIGDFVTFQN